MQNRLISNLVQGKMASMQKENKDSNWGRLNSCGFLALKVNASNRLLLVEVFHFNLISSHSHFFVVFCTWWAGQRGLFQEK